MRWDWWTSPVGIVLLIVLSVVGNLALLGASVWVIVQVLRSMGAIS